MVIMMKIMINSDDYGNGVDDDDSGDTDDDEYSDLMKG